MTLRIPAEIWLPKPCENLRNIKVSSEKPNKTKGTYSVPVKQKQEHHRKIQVSGEKPKKAERNIEVSGEKPKKQQKLQVSCEKHKKTIEQSRLPVTSLRKPRENRGFWRTT